MKKIFKSKLLTCILILVLATTIFVFAGDVTVQGGDLDIDGNLDVDGNLNVDGDLDIAGKVGGDLKVDGKITGPTGGGYPDAYIYYLYVDYYAEFYNSLHANYMSANHVSANSISANTTVSCYKLHADVIDPAGVLYDLQTRQQIIDTIKRTIAPEKQGGALVFFNTDTKRLESYVPGEGKFYDFQGNLLYTMPTTNVATDYKTIYYLDIFTGEVRTRQEVVSDTYIIKQGYRLDPQTGHFINMASGEIVPKEQAVELKEAL